MVLIKNIFHIRVAPLSDDLPPGVSSCQLGSSAPVPGPEASTTVIHSSLPLGSHAGALRQVRPPLYSSQGFLHPFGWHNPA